MNGGGCKPRKVEAPDGHQGAAAQGEGRDIDDDSRWD